MLLLSFLLSTWASCLSPYLVCCEVSRLALMYVALLKLQEVLSFPSLLFFPARKSSIPVRATVFLHLSPSWLSIFVLPLVLVCSFKVSVVQFMYSVSIVMNCWCWDDELQIVAPERPSFKGLLQFVKENAAIPFVSLKEEARSKKGAAQNAEITSLKSQPGEEDQGKIEPTGEVHAALEKDTSSDFATFPSSSLKGKDRNEENAAQATDITTMNGENLDEGQLQINSAQEVVMVGSPESDLSSELTKDELWFIFSCWTLWRKAWNLRLSFNLHYWVCCRLQMFWCNLWSFWSECLLPFSVNLICEATEVPIVLVITEPMLDCREMFEICKWLREEEGDKLISKSLQGVNCLGKPSPGSIHMDDVFFKSKVIERVVGIKGSPMCRVNKFSCLMCKYCWFR